MTLRLNDLASSVWLGYLAGTVIVIWLYKFCNKWVNHRRFYKDLPGPPHSFWTGHLTVFLSFIRNLPTKAHVQIAMVEISKEYDLGSVFYLDLFPLADSMLVIHDPDLAAQVIQERLLEAHFNILGVVKDLIGTQGISMSEGKQWKMFRTMLAPGFTSTQLNRWNSEILSCVKTFQTRLEAFAQTNEVFAMQEVGSYLTADIIGVIVLGEDFRSQVQHHPIVSLFRKMVTTFEGQPQVPGLAQLKSLILRKWYCRQLDQTLAQVVEKKYQQSEQGSKVSSKRAVIDMELEEYRRRLENPGIDPEVKFDKHLAAQNVKNLLFGGHDNSASVLSYTTYLLATHPSILAEVRREHDEVYSKDMDQTLQLIEEEPRRLKQLPLTTACIQEALRLFPTGNVPRRAAFGTYLDFNGRKLPCWDLLIWASHYGIQRNTEQFLNATQFDPKRFVGSQSEVAGRVPKEGWRPFEKGPRNCLGQELAMMEIKMILLVTLRTFDFQPAYERNAPRASDEHGGPAYQVFLSAPKPASGMPMRVEKRA